jgi:hypothetical protein
VARTKTTPRPRRLLDQPRAPDLPQPEHVRTMSGATTDEPIVVDDLPEVLPVTGPELNVIETYLGGLIDRLLTDASSDGAATPSPTSSPGMPIQGSRPRS